MHRSPLSLTGLRTGKCFLSHLSCWRTGFCLLLIVKGSVLETRKYKKEGNEPQADPSEVPWMYFPTSLCDFTKLSLSPVHLTSGVFSFSIIQRAFPPRLVFL